MISYEQHGSPVRGRSNIYPTLCLVAPLTVSSYNLGPQAAADHWRAATAGPWGRGRTTRTVEHYVRPTAFRPSTAPVAPTGNMMAVSGQVPAGRDGRPVGPSDPAAQV
jgi:hypothetical protein